MPQAKQGERDFNEQHSCNLDANRYSGSSDMPKLLSEKWSRQNESNDTAVEYHIPDVPLTEEQQRILGPLIMQIASIEDHDAMARFGNNK